MWASAAVCGLVANNVGPVANIVGRKHPIVAVNVVPDSGLFAGQAIYDCGPLHLAAEASGREMHPVEAGHPAAPGQGAQDAGRKARKKAREGGVGGRSLLPLLLLAAHQPSTDAKTYGLRRSIGVIQRALRNPCYGNASPCALPRI